MLPPTARAPKTSHKIIASVVDSSLTLGIAYLITTLYIAREPLDYSNYGSLNFGAILALLASLGVFLLSFLVVGGTPGQAAVGSAFFQRDGSKTGMPKRALLSLLAVIPIFLALTIATWLASKFQPAETYMSGASSPWFWELGSTKVAYDSPIAYLVLLPLLWYVFRLASGAPGLRNSKGRWLGERVTKTTVLLQEDPLGHARPALARFLSATLDTLIVLGVGSIIFNLLHIAFILFPSGATSWVYHNKLELAVIGASLLVFYISSRLFGSSAGQSIVGLGLYEKNSNTEVSGKAAWSWIALSGIGPSVVFCVLMKITEVGSWRDTSSLLACALLTAAVFFAPRWLGALGLLAPSRDTTEEETKQARWLGELLSGTELRPRGKPERAASGSGGDASRLG